MKRLPGLLVVVGVLIGCASTRDPLTHLTQAEWETALRQRGVDPREVANPLAFTEAMKTEAVRLAGFGDPLERLRRLQDSLFDQSKFPFTYELRGTLTAAEAYYRRQGNCLSFTNLFVAMGRSLGLPVTAALVTKVLGSEREEDLIVVNTHVVATYSHGGEITYYDFDLTRRRQPTALKTLDDLWVTALYLNNKGADELRLRHPETALRLFSDAVRLAPDFAAAWGNLGVARRRAADIDGALAAYEKALELEPHNPTVLSNLAALYRSLGRYDEAESALEAANFTRASAHQLLVRGDLDLAQGKVDEALRLFKRARRMAPEAPEVWVALARAELSRSRTDRAERYILKALELTPEHRQARAILEVIRDGEQGGPSR